MEERFRNIHPLRWFPEFLELTRRRFRSQGQLLATSVLVGIVAGLGAVLFSSLCNIVVHFTLDAIVGYRADGPANEPKLDWLHETATTLRPLLFLVIPTIGGLLSGFIVFSIAPEAEGHGTDAVIAAYHYRDGQIRARVPLVKIIASAITIGTGSFRRPRGDRSPRSAPASARCSPTSCICGRSTAASFWRPAWGPASPRSFARRSPGPCSRRRSCIVRPSSSRR